MLMESRTLVDLCFVKRLHHATWRVKELRFAWHYCICLPSFLVQHSGYKQRHNHIATVHGVTTNSMAERNIFPLERLPVELRMKIYPLCNNLALPHDGTLPPLLLALIPKISLFSEALSLHRKINYSISSTEANGHQERVFKAMRLKELLKIRHLRMVWQSLPQGNYMDQDVKEITLQAHKVLSMNNFESLTFVFERNSQYLQSRILLQYLMKASIAGVTRVVLRLGDADKMTKVKKHLDKFSGTEGTLVSTKHATRRNPWREEVWKWYVNLFFEIAV